MHFLTLNDRLEAMKAVETPNISYTRNSAGADKLHDAFRGQSRSPNIVSY